MFSTLSRDKKPPMIASPRISLEGTKVFWQNKKRCFKPFRRILPSTKSPFTRCVKLSSLFPMPRKYKPFVRPMFRFPLSGISKNAGRSLSALKRWRALPLFSFLSERLHSPFYVEERSTSPPLWFNGSLERSSSGLPPLNVFGHKRKLTSAKP